MNFLSLWSLFFSLTLSLDTSDCHIIIYDHHMVMQLLWCSTMFCTWANILSSSYRNSLSNTISRHPLLVFSLQHHVVILYRYYLSSTISRHPLQTTYSLSKTISRHPLHIFSLQYHMSSSPKCILPSVS